MVSLIRAGFYSGLIYQEQNRSEGEKTKGALSVLTNLLYYVAPLALCYPFELVSVKMAGQITEDKRIYSGFWDCLVKIWEEDGFDGLYKGFTFYLVLNLGMSVLDVVANEYLTWDKIKESWKTLGQYLGLA